MENRCFFYTYVEHPQNLTRSPNKDEHILKGRNHKDYIIYENAIRIKLTTKISSDIQLEIFKSFKSRLKRSTNGKLQIFTFMLAQNIITFPD